MLPGDRVSELLMPGPATFICSCRPLARPRAASGMDPQVLSNQPTVPEMSPAGVRASLIGAVPQRRLVRLPVAVRPETRTLTVEPPAITPVMASAPL